MFSNTLSFCWPVAIVNLVFTVVINSALGGCLNTTNLREDLMFEGMIYGIRLFRFKSDNQVRLVKLLNNLIDNKNKP